MANTQPVTLSCAAHNPTNSTPLPHLPRSSCHSLICLPCHRGWSSPCLARCRTPKMNFTPKPLEWGLQRRQSPRKKSVLASPDDEAGPRVQLSLLATGQARDGHPGPQEQRVLKLALEGHWAPPKLQATRWAQVGLLAASRHWRDSTNWTIVAAMVLRSHTLWCRRGPCAKPLWKKKTIMSKKKKGLFYLFQGGTRDVGACPKSQWIVFAQPNSWQILILTYMWQCYSFDPFVYSFPKTFSITFLAMTYVNLLYRCAWW